MALPEDALARLREFDDLPLVNEFGARLSEHPTPEVIYHYTSAAGLQGILQSGRLWFSDLFRQDDPSELRFGVEHACDLLDMRVRASDGGGELKLFSSLFREAIMSRVEGSAHYRLCCFSMNGDHLGQWRNYADDGRGFAIGFDAATLEQAFAAGSAGHSTFPVTYDGEAMRRLHEGILDVVLPLVSFPRGKPWPGRAFAEYEGRLAVGLAVHILHTALFFKHRGYRDQEEYRFLQVSRADRPLPDKVRRGPTGEEIKYCEFDWRAVAKTALRCVVVGPSVDPKAGADFVKASLTNADIRDQVGLGRSEIPYRSSGGVAFPMFGAIM